MNKPLLFALLAMVMVSGCTSQPLTEHRGTKCGEDWKCLAEELFYCEKEYKGVGDDLKSCQEDYRDLKIVQPFVLRPPYTYIEDRNVTSAFKTTDGNIVKWITTLDLYDQFVVDGYYMRNFEIEELESFGLGRLAKRFKKYGGKTLLITIGEQEKKFVQVLDFRPYVDSAIFEKVIQKLYAESGSDEKFVQEVYHIVRQLTVYSSEINENPRFPIETLVGSGGDCDDTSVLLASMLLATGQKDWDIEFAYMDLKNPLAPQEINHLVVYVNTGKFESFVDATSGGKMNPFGEINGWRFKI